MGKVLSDKCEKELTNVNAIIGQSGTGKSTLADAFGFLADCLEKGVEVACDLNGRGESETTGDCYIGRVKRTSSNCKV